MIMDNEFWQVKSMEDFTDQEWEQICLRCGKCCAVKTMDASKVYFYNRLCGGFDLESGLCKRYDTRLCDDCLKVDMEVLAKHPELLPETCAYRVLKEKGKLPEYHPLITGDAESVKKANQTVLDWKGVHTIENLELTVASVLDKANKGNWTSEQFEDAVHEAVKPFNLVIVEAYQKNGS